MANTRVLMPIGRRNTAHHRSTIRVLRRIGPGTRGGRTHRRTQGGRAHAVRRIYRAGSATGRAYLVRRGGGGYPGYPRDARGVPDRGRGAGPRRPATTGSRRAASTAATGAQQDLLVQRLYPTRRRQRGSWVRQGRRSRPRRYERTRRGCHGGRDAGRPPAVLERVRSPLQEVKKRARSAAEPVFRGPGYPFLRRP